MMDSFGSQRPLLPDNCYCPFITVKRFLVLRGFDGVGAKYLFMYFYLFSSAIDTWLVYFGDILKESLDHNLEM